MQNTVLVYRGTEVESTHNFSYVICNHAHDFIHRSHNVERFLYPRSAIKFFQAIPFVESGAYQASHSSLEVLALACASHNGEAIHRQLVQKSLHSNHLSPKDLRCGPSLPRLNQDIKQVYQSNEQIDPSFNNCSGKHTAMLLTAKHLALSDDYDNLDHPVQKMVIASIEKLIDKDLNTRRVGIDGCGLPNIMMSLDDLAYATARFSFFADQQKTSFEKACALIAKAITEHPYLIGGKERLCTEIISATDGRILAKVGAEGVYMAMCRKSHQGIALKVDDGAFRAVEVALVGILKKHGLITDDECKKLSKWIKYPILNTLNKKVGYVTANV